MNTNYFYKYLLFCTAIFLLSCSTAKKVAVDTEKGKYESNTVAYFKSNTPPTTIIPFETEEEYATRMQWWKDAKYGMFIHFGLYSMLGGEYNGKVTPKIAEWIQNTLKIPLADYKKLLQKFNPKDFNADEWVSVAKAAGMKYMVVTSKHHDGFALFNSKVSDYDVMNTPFGRDIIKELKDACKKQGLKFGLYYSHVIDWENPNAYIGEKDLTERMNTVDFDPAKMDRAVYLKEKSFPQLKELLTNYGTIDILWFDMGKGLNDDEIRQFVKVTRELQPNIIISSRIGDEIAPKDINKDMLFDFYTPNDNYFTGDQSSIPFEMAGTTNSSWGFRKTDKEWRKPNMILSSLIASASRGGNYLLNVGPSGTGELPQEAVENLKVAGAWLHKYGESVYGTQASPFPWNYNWGYVTQKPNKLFLNISDWPANNQIDLNGLITKIDNVHVLGNSQPIKFTQDGRFLKIDVSGVEKIALSTPLVVAYKDALLNVDHTISQGADNKIRLDRITGTYNKDELLSSWKFTVHTPGKYKIAIISNEKGGHSKPTWTGAEQTGSVQVAGKIIPVVLKRDEEKINPSLFFYKEIRSHVGEIEFLKAGTYTLQLKNIDVDADKWTKGFGLDRIELIKY
ncbi:MAG: alpha-L-fucosidase [Chitinophagaceae bacterium]